MKPLYSNSNILQLDDVYVDNEVIDTSSKNSNDVEDEDVIVIDEVEVEVEAVVEGEVEDEVQVDE